MAEFEAKCLEVIEEVDETGEPVFFTKDGVPIATLYPAQRKPKSIAGVMSRVN
jgi:antitoxin (DNA-binding transcriptional repressor) of toxin-antitoxin stability system